MPIVTNKDGDSWIAVETDRLHVWLPDQGFDTVVVSDTYGLGATEDEAIANLKAQLPDC